MKFYERLPWKPFRALALKKSKAWLFDHMERSEGFAAIYPSMQNSVFCLHAFGYDFDDPLVKQQMRILRRTKSKRRRAPHATVRFAGVGYRDRHGFARRSRALIRGIRRSLRLRIGCSTFKLPAAAIGR